MTRTIGASTLCLLLVVQVLAGCAGMTEQQKGTAVGAGAGAAVGATLGAIIAHKNPALGALIGAAGGAVIGGLIGWQVDEYRARKVKSAEQATATHKYAPQQGIVAKIDDTAAAPQQLKPGDQIVLKAQYTVLAPPEQGQVKVKEVRTIYFNDQRLGRLEKDSELTAGTYESEYPLKIPGDAAEGSYTVKTLVEPAAANKGVGDEATTAFAVGNALATPAVVSGAPKPVPVQRAQAEAALPAGQAALQTIRAVYNKDLLVSLKDVRLRGAVLIAVVSATNSGNGVPEYALTQGGHLLDYGTGKTYETLGVDGATCCRLTPGQVFEARLTFKAPPESVKVVGITLHGVGTFEDVKIRP